MADSFGAVDADILAALYFPEDEQLQEIYKSYAKSLVAELKGKPGVKTSHFMLADRLAYVYAQSVGVAGDFDVGPYEERGYLASFNRLFTEFMREMRTLSRDDNIYRAIVEQISAIINDELIDYPELRNRIALRLAELD